jgi:alpha-ketoglutarate-dependent taurine dioxygenase
MTRVAGSRAESAPLILEGDIRESRAWKGKDVSPGQWLVALPSRCVDELDDAARQLSREPLPTLLLDPGQFALAVCAEVMDRVREKLRTGIGVVVLDRVPVERYTAPENQSLAWLLVSLLGRPVAQKWDGTMLYDVRDTGKTLEYGVRRSVTNLDLTFHTDAPWLELPPELVGLYCLNPAREGGVSRFVSLGAVHNELRRRHADLVPRLYRPFPWDRQAEHAPEDAKISRHPIFRYDGRSLVGRCNERLVSSGAELAGEALDAEAREALDAMERIMGLPELRVELTIQRGQLQLIDNRQFAHSRTDFTDASEPHLKRHMIRLWTREEGHRTFHG